MNAIPMTLSTAMIKGLPMSQRSRVVSLKTLNTSTGVRRLKATGGEGGDGRKEVSRVGSGYPQAAWIH